MGERGTNWSTWQSLGALKKLMSVTVSLWQRMASAFLGTMLFTLKFNVFLVLCLDGNN